MAVDKTSTVKKKKNRHGSMGFDWDLFQFILFNKSGTVMMPKWNTITYKAW